MSSIKQQESISAFFRNKLTPEQEIEFLKEVVEDESLKDEFDLELLWHYGVREEDVEAVPEKHTIKTWIQRPWIKIAAVFIVMLSVYLIIKSTITTIPETEIAGKKDPPKKSLSQPDSLQAGKEMYNSRYKKYNSTGDPISISKYVSYYREGKFDLVLNSKPEHYQQMGSGNNDSIVEMYMNFYKGLCYLELNKPDEAISKFGLVLNGKDTPADLYKNAMEYTGLAYLKKGELQKAKKF